MRLSQNKHFLSVHVRLWTLSRSRRVTWREQPGARESGLFALGRGQVMRRRCLTATAIVFPPIILSKLIYDRLFGRWTVGEASWCACAQVCGAVRASTAIVTYLQMALGYDELSPLERPRSPVATQHPRKLRPDVLLPSFLHFMHVSRSRATTRSCRVKARDRQMFTLHVMP